MEEKNKKWIDKKIKEFEDEFCVGCDDGIRMLADIYQVSKIETFIRQILKESIEK